MSVAGSLLSAVETDHLTNTSYPFTINTPPPPLSYVHCWFSPHSGRDGASDKGPESHQLHPRLPRPSGGTTGRYFRPIMLLLLLPTAATTTLLYPYHDTTRDPISYNFMTSQPDRRITDTANK